MWTYSQSTGVLTDPLGTRTATGYSGKGDGKNNPAMQDVKAVGPIPRGKWLITGKPYDSARVGPYALVLEPMAGTITFGRGDFRIHGDSKSNPGTASNGCIILSRTIRALIYNSGDKVVQVVE